MELYLQCGWGMKEHCRVLLEGWRGGTVILSPCDMSEEELVRFAPDLHDAGAKLLLDPQFYLPRATRERLLGHAYWPESYDTNTFYEGEHQTMLKELARLNSRLGAQQFIVPGTYAVEVDEGWMATQRLFHEGATAVTRKPLVRTVALSTDAMKHRDQTQQVVELAESHPVPTHYLVLERGGVLLTDDPVWLANMLDLVASLKRGGSKVVLGYQNQQGLLAAVAGADAIASGTFENVRTFDAERFFQKREEEASGGPKPWYYLPQAFSEFRLNYLDLAQELGQLEQMEADPTTNYAAQLFDGGQPSASGWSRTEAFRHYLSALRLQVRGARRPTFEDTAQRHLDAIDTAEAMLGDLRQAGIRAERKDFAPAIEAHRSAVDNLRATHGGALRRAWAVLG